MTTAKPPQRDPSRAPDSLCHTMPTTLAQPPTYMHQLQLLHTAVIPPCPSPPALQLTPGAVSLAGQQHMPHQAQMRMPRMDKLYM